VEVDIRNFKGYNNTAGGMSRVYTLDPVKNWFNVAFDVVLYFVLMPFTRCALEGIKTLDDLRNCTLHQIPIHAHMLDLPLFLAGKPGGRGFRVPPAPMSASPLMMMMRNLGNRAGLPGATCYAFDEAQPTR
jgi:hypothetical protein